MKVTKITKQVKNQDRYSVYIDEKYSFSLSEYQLADSGLYSGKELSEAEVEDFANESQFGKMYERSLNYVMIRPRSRKEISDYLTRSFLYPKPKAYTDKNGKLHFKKRDIDREKVMMLIERVTLRLNEKGYLSDETFAKAWVRSRQLTKKSSRRKLQVELRAKGISEDIIATVLQNSEINEQDNLRELVEKKRKLSRYQDEHKLISVLLRHGFLYDDIRSALDQDNV